MKTLNNILYPYQKKFIMDDTKVCIWRKARQIGGSFSFAFKSVYKGLTTGENQIFISTNLRNAARLIEECKSILPLFEIATNEILKLDINNTLEIQLPNGAKIISIPNNPDTAVGYSGSLYIDEAARFTNSKELLEAVLPFITRGFQLNICSTPLGQKGFFYDYCQRALNGNKNFSIHIVNVYDAIAQGAPLDIDMLKEEMDEDSFLRNYMCQFLDDTDAYFTFELLQSCIDHTIDYMDETQLIRNNHLVAGLDLGKRVDSSVLTIVDKSSKNGFRALYTKEFLKVDYILQVEWISEFIKKYNIGKLYVDSTGPGGDALTELLKAKLGGRVCPVTFTNTSKEQMICNLKLLFEKKAIVIPDNFKLIDQLHGLNRTVLESGKFKYSHDTGKHDDYVWSLALATSDLRVDKSSILIPGELKKNVKLIKPRRTGLVF